MPNKKVINNAYTNPVNGLSYTNKDFNSIYNEQLDLVKELTDKWDPSMSNESDPGVVLLKENAILADKENYNIDKNVLELFPASVSQYGNARQLYDSLGYEMHWYRSATTSIYYSYKGDPTVVPASGFKIPNFTMVSDSSGQYIYTLINPPSIPTKNSTQQAEARQGIITDFEINGNTEITLNYLDSDFRIYFPDTRIAENGIFIVNIQPNLTSDDDYDWTGEWTKVSNLEGYNQGQKVYSFGVLPNSNTCYIQFPQDIADLIGNGLKIKYLVTMGQAGNVNERTINTLYSDLQVTFADNTTGTINDDISIINFESSMDGQDPEDLESAYHNYKKTVGTFNTLVTCRDYENGIYNLEENGKSLASNAVVSDRTNDINNSYNIVTLTTEGNDKELYVDIDSQSHKQKMTAFDLGLYVLQPMSSNYTAATYAESFSVNNCYQTIKQNIEDLKSIQHDYIATANQAIPFIIKNVYDVVGKVITYYKVTEEDAKNIEQQIILALYKRFNARNVDFGEPIDYDTLVQTIQNADSRIKSVIVNEPQYTTYVMYGNDVEGTVGSGNCHPLITPTDTEGLQKQFLTGLIGNGNVQLYNFNPDFEYEFGQTDIATINEVSKITSETAITVPTSGTYPIKENENVIIISPNYITKTSYTYHVRYSWNGSADIPKDEIYEIQSGDKLTLSWESNSQSQSIDLTAGTMIKSSIKIDAPTTPNTTTDGILGQTDSIDVLELNSTTYSTNGLQNSIQLDSGKELPCCWFLNDPNNVLFRSEAEGQNNITWRILDQNEYFIYSNGDLTDLVILGSGTKISTNSEDFGEIKFDISNIDIDKILSGDTFDLNWQYPLNNSNLDDITFQEMSMIVLEPGVEIYQDSGAITQSLSNSYQPIANGKSFYYGDSEITSTSVVAYRIRSRLNIVSSLKNPQKLFGYQTFTVTPNNSSAINIIGSDSTPVSVKFNYNIVRGGGKNLDFATIDTDGSTTYPVNLTYYKQDPDIEFNENEYIDVVGSASGTETLEISFASSAEYTIVIPIMITGNASKISSIQYEWTSEDEDTLDISDGTGTYYINPPEAVSTLTLTITFTADADDSTHVLVGKVYPYNGYANTDSLEALGIEDPGDLLDDVVENFENFKAEDSKYNYDYSYKVPESDLVEDPLSPDSFWNSNNPYNRFTIAQMGKCNVKVISSSKL